jgi:hypothetical protein
MIVAGDTLARRQVGRGPLRGNVPPAEGIDDADFHGTLASIWLWSRAQLVAGEARFGFSIGNAWAFVEQHWDRYIPRALDDAANEEAPYACAMVLRAGLATHAVSHSGDWRRYAEAAARLLSGYLGELEDVTGRGFQDPGFLAWNLGEYARAVKDRGLQAAVARFVDKRLGMKLSNRFDEEPQSRGDLFDFSSTTAMRVLAVMAAEGETPFIGSWLRERIAPRIPATFVPRFSDENPWNACVAVVAGRAFLISTDERFRGAHENLIEVLLARAGELDGGIGRAPGFPSETCATFYFGLALDALVRSS